MKATYTTNQLTAMRGWIADCTWMDLDEADIEELTPEQLERGIQRNYDGGMRQFLRDVEPEMIGGAL